MFPSVHIGYITGNAEDWLSSVAWLFILRPPWSIPRGHFVFACEIPTLYPGGHQVCYRKNPTLASIPREASTRHRAVWTKMRMKNSEGLEFRCCWKIYWISFAWDILIDIFLMNDFVLFSVFRNSSFKTKMCWPAYGQVLTSQNNAWNSSEG